MHLEKEEGASIDGGEGGMSEQAIVSEEMKPVVRKSQEGAGALRRSQAGVGHTGLVVKFWRFFILYVYPIFVYPTTVQVLEVCFSFCVSLQLGARRSTRLLVVYILDYRDPVLMFIFTFVLETTLQ